MMRRPSFRRVAINVSSPAVESSLSAAPLAPAKTIADRTVVRRRVCQLKQTEQRDIVFPKESV